jgi:hypothetical protein
MDFLRNHQAFVGRIGISFLNSQFVHKSCGKDVDRFGDESKNIIKICTFLKIALF